MVSAVEEALVCVDRPEPEVLQGLHRRRGTSIHAVIPILYTTKVLCYPGEHLFLHNCFAKDWKDGVKILNKIYVIKILNTKIQKINRKINRKILLQTQKCS